MKPTLKKIRIDKWLWAVRIFKTRTLATKMCKAGRVKMDGIALKPSYLIVPGDTIEVKKEGFNFIFKVVALIDKRVSATLAEPCYENLTSEEELNKFKSWYTASGSVLPERRDKGAGRPTKRERRMIDKFKSD